MNDDDFFVMCVRVSDESDPVESSREIVCTYCLAPVWLTAGTIDTIKRARKSMDGVKPICIQCAKTTFKEKPEIIPPGKAQRKEFRDHLRKRGMKP